MRCQASSEVSRTEASSGGEMPAMLKRTSMRPCSARVREYIACTRASSVTSASCVTNSPALRSTPTTVAPSAANSSQVAAPIPPAAPGTTHTLPPSRPSATFEHAAPLVVGDDLVEQALLGPPVVEVVPPDRLTERALGELARLPQLDRLAQRGRARLRLGLRGGVPDERGPGVGAVLDAVEPRGEQRRIAQIWGDVGARDAPLAPP